MKTVDRLTKIARKANPTAVVRQIGLGYRLFKDGHDAAYGQGLHLGYNAKGAEALVRSAVAAALGE